MSLSNKWSIKFSIIECSELFRRSMLWSMPHISSLFSIFTLFIVSVNSCMNLFFVQLGGLYVMCDRNGLRSL